MLRFRWIDVNVAKLGMGRGEGSWGGEEGVGRGRGVKRRRQRNAHAPYWETLNLPKRYKNHASMLLFRLVE